MTYPRNAESCLRYDYDFAVDGGAVGAISLSSNLNRLVEGLIVKEIMLVVKTAVTSGGTPTITLGNTADPDGYMADIFSFVGSAPAVVNSGSVAGDLIWDDTNDHAIHYRISSATNTQDLVLTVGTAALTAGKFEIYLKCQADVSDV